MIKIIKDKMKDKSFREMLDKEGFKLAFGVSIIILGIISIFYDTSNTILIGVSISSLLFTIIDAIFPGKGLFQFLPVSILLIFCIFPDISYINELLNSKLNNAIIFFSFGISFLISSINTYKNILNRKREDQKYFINTATIISNQFDNYIYLSNDLVKIKNILDKNNVNIKELNDIMIEVKNYIQNEYIVSKFKFDLSLKGQEETRNSFSIYEIEEAIKNNIIFNNDVKVKKSIDEIKKKSNDK